MLFRAGDRPQDRSSATPGMPGFALVRRIQPFGRMAKVRRLFDDESQ